MGRPNIQTYQNEVKAAHGYKVVDAEGKPSVAGKRFHFIGAGGIGMSGLAKLLIKHKAIVAGSDQTASGVVEKLCEMGADIKIGHNADNLNPETDAVVISAAVKEDNPELKLARKTRQEHDKRVAHLFAKTSRPRPKLYHRG
jgi:UDP-N-acetylmuramate-alanine ligase